MGHALIDTGLQVSLVKADGLSRGSRINKYEVEIHGITGNSMKTRGYIELSIGDASFHRFLVVENLRMNCEVILGQGWLERFVFQLRIQSVGLDIFLPAYSETVVRIPTTEKGSRLIEAQELQENIFCASSVVECTDSSFVYLIIN
jgi:hypothetical protein